MIIQNIRGSQKEGITMSLDDAFEQNITEMLQKVHPQYQMTPAATRYVDELLRYFIFKIRMTANEFKFAQTDPSDLTKFIFTENTLEKTIGLLFNTSDRPEIKEFGRFVIQAGMLSIQYSKSAHDEDCDEDLITFLFSPHINTLEKDALKFMVGALTFLMRTIIHDAGYEIWHPEELSQIESCIIEVHHVKNALKKKTTLAYFFRDVLHVSDNPENK